MMPMLKRAENALAGWRFSGTMQKNIVAPSQERTIKPCQEVSDWAIARQSLQTGATLPSAYCALNPKAPADHPAAPTCSIRLICQDIPLAE